jgi:hypothetical protein
MKKAASGTVVDQMAKAYEARDKKADKKAGIKEDSKKDMAMDAKAMKAMPQKK